MRRVAIHVYRLRALLVLLLAMAVAAGLLALWLDPAHASTTFTVNSTGDPGDGTCDATECTLREAITAANVTKGADTITFNIPGSGVQKISPSSKLPTIIHPVTIDGYTQPGQPGASPNTNTDLAQGTNAVLLIELDGTNAGSGANGLQLNSGFNGADASNSVIRGLVINNFAGSGILLFGGGTGYKIEGNFIGTDPSGIAVEGNADGVNMQAGASHATIGGTSPADRNLISANRGDGIDSTQGGKKIEGNLIGTKADGTSALGNRRHGVFALGTSNTIGDSDPSDGATNAANTIAFNVDTGVFISESQSVGTRILSNSIFSNGDLGIDLNSDGVTPNDPKDPDTGPNRLQNYPEITGTQVFPEPPFGTVTSITGKLESTPSTKKKKRTFIIQFFSNPSADSPSGFGEGQAFLGAIQVNTDRQGNAGPFTFTAKENLTDKFITATATNKKTGDTSEFSKAKRVEGPIIEP